MTAQFHEGQDVEVLTGSLPFAPFKETWRKAKIVSHAASYVGCNRREDSELWHVQFPDGTRVVFDAEHIRAFVSDAEIAAYIKRIGDQDKADCIE